VTVREAVRRKIHSSEIISTKAQMKPSRGDTTRGINTFW
jgi:hypothetical protein